MELYSTIDIARRLGVAEHRITYAHRCGKLAEPNNHIAGKRIYTEADLNRIADHFGVPMPQQAGSRTKQ